MYARSYLLSLPPWLGTNKNNLLLSLCLRVNLGQVLLQMQIKSFDLHEYTERKIFPDLVYCQPAA